MTPPEIIRAHAKNQGLDESTLSGQIHDFLLNPKTQVFQQNDCLFLIKNEDDVGFFYILNGGNATGYIRALRLFVAMMKKLGYRKIAMRVQDQDQSAKIAKSAGVNSISYKTVGGENDPYLMIMKV
ncbi:hypothetical protein UFOVP239_54 [uncultured Caudovirales phage]|uniref:Uncharacterized protein n=1 Tax=uncultured Caudovirales phage TaxID=2100421 RepID=A0A6J7WQ29_9CAUD|nr:hypothetical protein UFOVP239_54 [uncultured Caudovirales phage]